VIAYKIKNWDDHFEIAQSRNYKRMWWVAMPVKHDGKGYRRLAKHARSVELFAAWILMVQVASKMKVRGLLADLDGPLTAEDLADKTGFPEDIFKLAFDVLVEPRIDWLEKVNLEK
jgi:hypothetical protein